LEGLQQKLKLSECCQFLSGIYERRDDLGKALDYYKQFHIIKEQVFNEKADWELKKLQVKHKTETAKQEAEIFRLKNIELQEALEQVKKLSGLLPICANCKKIRDDGGYWHDVAVYIDQHSEAKFSHGICPDCVKKLYPDVAEEMEERAGQSAVAENGRVFLDDQ
jgi:hypothetical protein